MASFKDKIVSPDNNPSYVDFRLLFESSPGLFLILSKNLNIVAVSDAYLQATMTQRNQIMGKNLFEVFPDNPDDPRATGETNLRASLNYVLQHKTAHTMAVQKYDIRKPDGEFEERFWSPLNKPVLDRHNEILYIIHRVEDVTEFIRMKEEEVRKSEITEKLKSLASDREQEIYKRAREIQDINNHLLNEIAERKAMEEKLKDTQLMLQSTIESHKDLLIFCIDRDYRFLNFNSAFKTATGYAYGTVVELGASMLESITDVDDRKKAKDNCDRALNGESHITIEEYGEKERYYFENRYNPICNDQKEVIGVTVMSSNVTERICAEQKIQTLNKELEAFTYTVAHDLRAPLRIIDGYAGILTEDYTATLDKEAKRLLGVVSSSARQMGQLIDDLLNFSKLGGLSVDRKPIDMQNLFNIIFEEQLMLVPRDRIEIQIGKLESVKCDGNLMRHVLGNLVSNAIKYSRKKERAIIQVGSERKDSEIIYFVKDNGSGFDMNYADKLFGVFQRLHRVSEFEGTGVGLAIVQKVIAKHGGRVWAEAEPEKGATFYFSLPVEV